jgi:hypothetical protein
MTSAHDLLDAALAYAALGWPVFPVHYPLNGSGCSCGDPGCENVGKHPRTTHGLKDATTDPAQIRTWWQQWPKSNIGMPTGTQTGVAVDIDPRNGAAGSLEALEDAGCTFPLTVESHTGGGGKHLLYRHPGGRIKNSAGHVLGQGLDIRGDGGYIILPPSRHACGQAYVWEASSAPFDLAMEPMPAWLIAKLRDPEPHRDNGHCPAGGRIAQGQRNDTLTRVAGSMRRQGLDATTIEGALLVINARQCEPPLPDDEIQKIAVSVGRYAPEKNPNISETELTKLSKDPSGTFGTAESAETAAEDDGAGEARKDRRSMGDRLIGYALEDATEFFVDQFHQGHALVNGQAIPLHRGAYTWLRQLFYRHEQRGLSGEALQMVAGTLEAKAVHELSQYELHVRSAWHQGALYVELQPGRVLQVDATGWRIDADPPVRFRRFPNLGRLPDPKPCDSYEDLLDVLLIQEPVNRRLLGAHLATELLPHISRPILLLTGPQGAAKSTRQRLIKRVLDPGKPETIRLDPKDILQKAMHTQVVMVDNLSTLPDWALDLLCRLCTGEADSKRKLYADDEDIIYELKRAVLLNGVNPPGDRPDFNDRLLPIEVERLTPEQRRTEEVLWGILAERHAHWLGALFTQLSKAMGCRARVAEEMPQLPRLADWGLWAAALYKAQGHEYAVFLEDWKGITQRQQAAVVEGSPVAQVVLKFMSMRSAWEGTYSELYDALAPTAEAMHVAKDRAWPRASRWLSRYLNELSPVLRDYGIELIRDRRTNSTRWVTLKKG